MFNGMYGESITALTPDGDEVIEITRKKKAPEPFPGYTIFGNGKTTRKGGESMDILDVCEQLNKGEMALMKVFRNQLERNKIVREKNLNIVVPAKIDEWDNRLKIALKKNYAHMFCVGIIRRVKRGTYMLNPRLFIPPFAVEEHIKRWEELEECNDPR